MEVDIGFAPAVKRCTEKLMPHDETIALTGVIQHVIAHRLTIAA